MESSPQLHRTRSPSFEIDDGIDFADWDSTSSRSISPSPSPSQSFDGTAGLARLSLHSNPPTPTRGRRSVSTAPTSNLSRSDSSDWSDHALEEEDEEEEADRSRHSRLASTSAPVGALQIPVIQGGRKRSLTDVLQLDDEDQKVHVALELCSWVGLSNTFYAGCTAANHILFQINASPSPFEHDSPRTTPLPRPFPQFPAFLSSTPAAQPRLAFGLDSRGLPAERQEEAVHRAPLKSSYGFIPGPLLNSPAVVDKSLEDNAVVEDR